MFCVVRVESIANCMMFLPFPLAPTQVNNDRDSSSVADESVYRNSGQTFL